MNYPEVILEETTNQQNNGSNYPEVILEETTNQENNGRNLI